MQYKRFIIYSFALILLSFIIRILGYTYTKNIALAMESLHIIIDVIITIFILIALNIISSKYSLKFSYGLFKIEDLISLFLAILVAFTGIDLLISGFISKPSMTLISSIIQAISVIPILFSANFKRLAGEELKSPSLKNDGKHSLTDFYEGIGVSVGLFLSYFFGPILYYLSIFIAFIALIFTAYSIGKDSILSLLDLPKDKNLKEKIFNIVSSVEKVKNVKEVRFRWAGPIIFVEIVVEMDPLLTISDAHPITEIIENKIKENIEGIYSVTVHVEPIKRKNFKIIIPSNGIEKISKMDEKLAKANYFAIVQINEHVEWKFIENPFKEKEGLAGLDFKEFLLNNDITDIICYNVGEITYGLMISYGIYCWHSEIDTLENVIENFLNGKLSKMEHPTKKSKSE
ncbi:MAG: cation diffusion facilitator family transporter [Thermoplasmata archaeon]